MSAGSKADEKDRFFFFGAREPGMKDWSEDWVSLYFVEDDLRKFEQSEQETQERLQVAVLDEKEVDQLEKDRETIGVSLAFFWQHRDNLIVEYCETEETYMK